jgi:LacI family transcriptional regulator
MKDSGTSSRDSVNRVCIAISSENGIGRGILRGIVNYVNHQTVEPWEFFKIRNLHDVGEYQNLPAMDGAIAVSWDPDVAALASGLGAPLVGVLGAPRAQPFPQVNDDQEGMIRAGLDYFLDRGFEYFGYVDMPFRPSHRGGYFPKYAETRDMSYSVFPPEPQGYAQSLDSFHEGLAEWLCELPKPVGILSYAIQEAIWITAACRETHISIPEDVAILSCGGDDLEADMANPSISMIDTSPLRIGYVAAELLDKKMQGQFVPDKNHVVPIAGFSERKSTDTLAVQNPYVREAVQFIRQEALQENITVDDVMERIPISRRGLEYAFQKELHRSIHKEIYRVRLQRACDLLRSTELSLPDICAQTCFSYPSFFCNTFKKHFGLTPIQYRNQWRNLREPSS